MIAAEPAAGAPHRWLLLALLTAALALSFVDRYLLAVLVQPIKLELGLSDTMIGALTGFAFSAFYALFGVPMARIADRGWRRTVIIGSVIVWSAMTALGGVVANAWQLAVVRFGVGAGEAGVFPASQATIAELFSPAARNGALAIFGAGGSIGILIAFVAGTQLEAAVGWRMTFVAMLVPGIVVAALLWLLLPPSGPRAASSTDVGVFRRLWANPSFRHLPFAQSALVVLIFGQTQWLPAFVERSFGASRTEIGAMLGLTQGVASIAGIVVGGFVAARLARRDPRWPMRVALVAVALSLGPALALYLAPSARVVYLWSAVTAFLMSAPAGPIAATLQNNVDPDQRATASATVMMVASLIGLGGGPLVIGVLSDALTPSLGAEALRYALLATVSASALWALFHLWRLNRLAAGET